MFSLWCLTPILTILQLYRGNRFYWCRKPEYPEKVTKLSLVTDKIYHIMLYREYPAMSEVLTSFPHSWLIIRFVKRVTRRVSHVELELHTIPGYVSWRPFYSTWISGIALSVTDKIYHIMLYREYPAMSEVLTHCFSGVRHWLHR
jgi:hypothetical protein